MQRSSAVFRSRPSVPPAPKAQATLADRLAPLEYLDTATGCEQLGDTLRWPQCPLQKLSLDGVATPRHLFECLPFNTSLQSLDLTNAHTLGEDGISRPLDRADYQCLVDYLAQRPAPLSCVYVRDHVLTAGQIRQLNLLGTKALRKPAVIERSRASSAAVRGEPPRDRKGPATERPRAPVQPLSRSTQPPSPSPSALSQPDTLHLAMTPWRLAEELNQDRVEGVRLGLMQCHQAELVLTGQTLSQRGVHALGDLLRRDVSGQVKVVDLRHCVMRETATILHPVLLGCREAPHRLQELWLDIAEVNPLGWRSLWTLLECGRLHRLVLDIGENAPAQKPAPLVREAVERHWACEIWLGSQRLYPTAAPAVVHPPTAAPLSDRQLHEVLCAGSIGLPTLRNHLTASDRTLRFPLNHLSKADADLLGQALVLASADIASLDLSHCRFAPSPLFGDRRGALLRVLQRVDTLNHLWINAEDLTAADWTALGTLVDAGRIGHLRLFNAGHKAISRAQRMIDRNRHMAVRPVIDWEGRPPTGRN